MFVIVYIILNSICISNFLSATHFNLVIHKYILNDYSWIWRDESLDIVSQFHTVICIDNVIHHSLGMYLHMTIFVVLHLYYLVYSCSHLLKNILSSSHNIFNCSIRIVDRTLIWNYNLIDNDEIWNINMY